MHSSRSSRKPQQKIVRIFFWNLQQMLHQANLAELLVQNCKQVYKFIPSDGTIDGRSSMQKRQTFDGAKKTQLSFGCKNQIHTNAHSLRTFQFLHVAVAAAASTRRFLLLLLPLLLLSPLFLD
jgi:hypothetical protein